MKSFKDILNESERMRPFHGGIKTKNITKKHVPLVWENMLGTVYARNHKTGDIKYFDYDYNSAHEHANTKNMKDLRISRTPQSYDWTRPGYRNSTSTGPRKGKIALWGIPPEE